MTDHDELFMAGFDFGSTTSHAVVARARVRRSSITGRRELGGAVVTYGSPVVFTPFRGAELDAGALAALVRGWMADCGVPRERFTAGGAIVTGLAARSANAGVLAEIVTAAAGETMFATADDPHLESWLAFHGNCAALSRASPARRFCNLDIGGGTTNVACGAAGVVDRTAAAFLGARHLRFHPGSYELVGTTPEGAEWLCRAGVGGPILSAADVSRVVRGVVDELERLVEPGAAVTFSGGVGECVYRLAAGETLGVTPHGDLGVDLAHGIAASALLGRDLGTFVPPGLGRATVYGMALNHVEIAGATVHLPEGLRLPLKDLPVLGHLEGAADLAAALARVQRSPRGGAFQLTPPVGARAAKAVGEALAAALDEASLPADRPLVIFVASNVGKTLGRYASRWGRLAAPLVVIDELDSRGAHFASIGAVRGGVLPVSFHGMTPLARAAVDEACPGN